MHNDEYKALRDEIVSLFHRSFITMGAVISASALVTMRIYEVVTSEMYGSVFNTSSGTYLSLINSAVISIGVLLASKFYDHISRIAGYIIAQYEPNGGFHTWNPRIPSTSRPKGRGRRWSIAGRFNEPQVVVAVYSILSVNGLLLVFVTMQRESMWVAVLAVIALSAWFFYILWPFYGSFELQSAWAETWRKFIKEETEESTGTHRGPHRLPFRHSGERQGVHGSRQNTGLIVGSMLVMTIAFVLARPRDRISANGAKEARPNRPLQPTAPQGPSERRG